MKNHLLIGFLLFIGNCSYAQIDVLIKFKDKSEISDKVISFDSKLISIKTAITYSYDNINEIIVTDKNKIKHYYILDTKLYQNTKKTLRGIGSLIYKKGKLELYRVLFYLDLSKVIRYSYDKHKPKFGVYIKRKEDKYTYNIGCIDGMGCVDVKKRVKDFFYDCPKLVKQLKTNEIDKYDIYKMLSYYNEHCDEQ